MPYVAEADTSVPRVIAVGEDVNGNPVAETEAVVYGAGAVIDENDIEPDTLDRLESGDDERLSALLRHVDDEEANRIRAEQGVEVAVVPEHEAEAEVLHQDGQDVLTHDEVIEQNLTGDVPSVAGDQKDDSAEGREAEDPAGVRVKEVDAKRRGDSPAPQGKAAASEDSIEDAVPEDSSEDADEDLSVKELEERARELDIQGRSSMNKEQLAAAVEKAEADQKGQQQS